MLLTLITTLLGAWPALGEPRDDIKPPSSQSDSIPIPNGYRGVSLPIPGYQLASIKKGDRADVLLTFEATMADKAKEKVTATILQDVVVVDIQKPLKLDEKGVVVLMLNPVEAQYAALSYSTGELMLSRRAERDTEMKPMEMASLRKLFK
jgi:Flp pilus assembly protein CpaB